MFSSKLCEKIFMIHPSPMFIVNSDVRIAQCNDSALSLLNKSRGHVLGHRSGTVLYCINSDNDSGGCGCSNACDSCNIRTSITNTFEFNKNTFQTPTELIVYLNSKLVRVSALITTLVLTDEVSVLIIDNISELNKLKELIPICSGCNRIRDDSNYWKTVEDYIEEMQNVDMTHGLCPKCTIKYHPELADDILKNQQY